MNKPNLEYNYRIESIEDIRPAAELFMRLSSELGAFKILMIDDISSPQNLVDANGNPLATEYFGWNSGDSHCWDMSEMELDAPISDAVRYESEPFYADQDKLVTFQSNTLISGFGINLGNDHEYCYAAITTPIRLPFGRVGAAAWFASDAETTDTFAIYEEFADRLMVMALKFLSGYVKVQSPCPNHPHQPNLSKREIQCIKWVAHGKTDNEIATIVGISHATVRFHVQNAARKLDTVSRAQTVFRASQLGYLTSSPKQSSTLDLA